MLVGLTGVLFSGSLIFWNFLRSIKSCVSLITAKSYVEAEWLKICFLVISSTVLDPRSLFYAYMIRLSATLPTSSWNLVLILSEGFKFYASPGIRLA